MIASQFYLLKNDRHRLIIRLMFISLGVQPQNKQEASL